MRPRTLPVVLVFASSSAALGTGTHVVIDGVEAVFDLPSAPKGLVLLAHGCQHSATDFWPHSASWCPTCTRLPEEVRISSAITAAGWGAIALSSADRQAFRCWSPETDGARVVGALARFREEHGLARLPLAAIGASSGGAFVLHLARLLPLQAIVSQIMAVPPTELQGFEGGPFPPTLFIHMQRDRRTGGVVQRCVRKLDVGAANPITPEKAAISMCICTHMPRPFGTGACASSARRVCAAPRSASLRS